MIYRRGKRFLILPAALLGLLSGNIFAADLVHIVAKGETVYSISRSYHISPEELMRYNKIADASKLQAGARLSIPQANTAVTTNTPTVASQTYSQYTVQPNDTLYSLAIAYRVTLQALRDLNGFSQNYVLKAGEKIKIPKTDSIVSVPPIPDNPVPRKAANSSLRWPVVSKEVLYMNNNMGVFVLGRESESVKSLTRGTVVYASPWRGYGNVAVIETEGGYRYLYGACGSLSVRKGDAIEPGTELGKLGIYPASGKPQLVLIVSRNGSPIDPAKAPRF
jgi:LysM repeat protein